MVTSPVKPFVVAQVHFVLDMGPHALECRPATVLRAVGDKLDLMVFTLEHLDGMKYADGHYLALGTQYADGLHLGGTWHWPGESCKETAEDGTVRPSQ